VRQCAEEGVSLKDGEEALRVLETKSQAIEEAKRFSASQEKLISINAKLEANLRVSHIE
jgi:hypothetical protein